MGVIVSTLSTPPKPEVDAAAVAPKPKLHRRSDTSCPSPEVRLSPVASNAIDGRLTRIPSELLHDKYLAKLEVPTFDQISSIAQVQEKREREIARKYARLSDDEQGGHEEAALREEAAGKIQRTYRGHRARRELHGLTLDPTARWVEALKAARYQNATNPKRERIGATPPSSRDGEGGGEGTLPGGDADAAAKAQRSLGARSNWHHIGNIASHAMGELPGQPQSGTSRLSPLRHQRPTSSQSQSSADGAVGEMSAEAIEEGRDSVSKGRPKKKKHKAPWAGKMMDLPYFLEMVDVKHRYGSNLRAYHAEWKKSDTRQNFFYWLDYGEGKDVEIDSVSRETLEKEQVRYLSREERMAYLVQIDEQGRLVWAKNGERITTSTDYRDSIEGIVPVASKAKMFREDEIKALEGHDDAMSDSLSSETEAASRHSSPFGSATASPTSTPDDSEAERRYPDPPSLAESKGPTKVKNISAHAILNRLLRKTVLKKNTWIFAFDTSMNLYVGIKQSGSFQHSSFMRGSRISAAGTIRIKNGQLRALNPLSGHYRPPARAFRHFVRHLKAENADMSRVSISKSYAVLVGLEMYMSGRQKVKNVEQKVTHGADLVVHPQKAREQRERDKDHSQSAELERAHLREEKSTLGRVLEDARAKVEQGWTAIREPEAIAAVAQAGEPKRDIAEGASIRAREEQQERRSEEEETKALVDEVNQTDPTKKADASRITGLDAETQAAPEPNTLHEITPELEAQKR